MPDLIPPHGGLREPIDRTVPAAEVPDFRRRAASRPRVPVSNADLSSLYRIGDGGLSPLAGVLAQPVASAEDPSSVAGPCAAGGPGPARLARVLRSFRQP